MNVFLLMPTSLQLALSREQELEDKLASMQEVINTSRQLATESMIVRNRGREGGGDGGKMEGRREGGREGGRGGKDEGREGG